ncbi:MAG: response regulator [Chloroflexi bacterium]|nr:response regulator [Chloroflexota bacterium]
MGKTCVLMVDDDPNILKFVSANLEIRGYDVITAEDGETALEVMDRTMPNLVILDLLMPGIDGFDVCRHIRKSSDVPIIVLSAIGESNTRSELLALGANDYVTKPFDIRDLLDRVQSTLDNRR